MSTLIDKRKRSREDDLLCETPLSKRINNLHLTNFEENQFQQLHDAQIQNHNISAILLGAANMQPNANNKHIMESYAHNHQHHHHHHHHEQQNLHMHEANYDPELNEAENPIYYLKNKLLHELHMERLKRYTI